MATLALWRDGCPLAFRAPPPIMHQLCRNLLLGPERTRLQLVHHRSTFAFGWLEEAVVVAVLVLLRLVLVVTVLPRLSVRPYSLRMGAQEDKAAARQRLAALAERHRLERDQPELR